MKLCFMQLLLMVPVLYASDNNKIYLCQEQPVDAFFASNDDLTSTNDDDDSKRLALNRIELKEPGQEFQVFAGYPDNSWWTTGDYRCRLELTACSACRLKLTMPKCPHLDNKSDRSGTCLRVTVEEPDFNSSRQNLVASSSSSSFYLTESYIMAIEFVYDSDNKRDYQSLGVFPLSLLVQDNVIVNNGTPRSDDPDWVKLSGFIHSPNFPDAYRPSVVANYTLINEQIDGVVRLQFLDFQLHLLSVLRVLDSDGKEIVSTQNPIGLQRRPSMIQSSGPILYVLFSAEHYSHDVGFRASYTFVDGNGKLMTADLSTKTCDQQFQDKGGVINATSYGLQPGSYIDCLWIIDRSKYALPLYDSIFLKVHDFSLPAAVGKSKVQLEIRKGRTSIAHIEQTIFGPLSREQLTRLQPAEGFTNKLTAELDSGFYVRLQGWLGFGYNGEVMLSYAQFYRFATSMCSDSHDFHCRNRRCIKSSLRCDSVDHCGDFSDEENCNGFVGGSDGGKRDFDNAGPSLRSLGAAGLSPEAVIILVATLVALTLIMLLVTLVVARIYRQRLLMRMQQQQSTNGGSNSSATNSSQAAVPGLNTTATTHRVGERRFFVFNDPQVPVFEAPPTYADALKHPAVPPSSNRCSVNSVMSADALSEQSQVLNSVGADTIVSRQPVEEIILSSNCCNNNNNEQQQPNQSVPSTSSTTLAFQNRAFVGDSTTELDALSCTSCSSTNSSSSADANFSGSARQLQQSRLFSPAGHIRSNSQASTISSTSTPEAPVVAANAPVSTGGASNRLSGILRWARQKRSLSQQSAAAPTSIVAVQQNKTSSGSVDNRNNSTELVEKASDAETSVSKDIDLQSVHCEIADKASDIEAIDKVDDNSSIVEEENDKNYAAVTDADDALTVDTLPFRVSSLEAIGNSLEIGTQISSSTDCDANNSQIVSNLSANQRDSDNNASIEEQVRESFV